MGFSCGIVGLPNVGKSTLFNAITSTVNAQSANYPFCTIEPNKASIAVPDGRLSQLSKISNSKNTVPTSLQIVDIAGLIKDASKGEGLGNQFLENIRSVDAIMHVVRCFDDKDIIHVEESINPVRDAEIVEMELLLSDISLLEKRIADLQKKNQKSSTAEAELNVYKKLLAKGQQGILLSNVELEDEDENHIAYKTHLLTRKPIMYIANVSEDGINGKSFKEIAEFAESRNTEILPICAKMESEMIDFSEADKLELVNSVGFSNTALNKLIQHGHTLLNLITFFTSGEKETRAWSIQRNSLAPQAAGKIHTDFEKGFIKAETISLNDFIKHQGYNGAKLEGKCRSEGKEYVVQDGDVILFRFNV